MVSAFAMIHCVAFLFVYYFQFTFGCTKTDDKRTTSKGKSGIKTRRRWIRFQRCISNLLQNIHAQLTEHLSVETIVCQVRLSFELKSKSAATRSVSHKLSFVITYISNVPSDCMNVSKVGREISYNFPYLILYLPWWVQKKPTICKYSHTDDLLLFIRFSVYGETLPRNVHIVGFHIHPFAILFERYKIHLYFFVYMNKNIAKDFIITILQTKKLLCNILIYIYAQFYCLSYKKSSYFQTLIFWPVLVSLVGRALVNSNFVLMTNTFTVNS